jgi:hypothetical protein
MADDNPPPPQNKPKAPDQNPPKDPAPKATEASGCCCDHITLYLEMIHVITNTNSAGPAPISTFIGFLTDDYVLVKCTSCDNKMEVWPHHDEGQDCPKCKLVTPHAPLATIKPTNCWVSCHVRVEVLKATKFDKILEALNNLFAELAKAYAQYLAAKAAGQASLLSGLLNNIDSLNKDITTLENLITGSKDSLMGEIYVNFEGSLACDAKLKDAIELPHGVKEISNDEVAVNQTFSALGGEWEIELRAIRSCPARRTTPAVRPRRVS